MKVLCKYNRIDSELADKVGLEPGNPTIYGTVSVGNEYLVLGISYDPTFPTYARWPICWLRNDSEGMTTMPLFMFEVIDASVSCYWEAKFNGSGALDFLPKSLFDPYYADDLSNEEPAVRKDFDRVYELLAEEEANRS